MRFPTSENTPPIVVGALLVSVLTLLSGVVGIVGLLLARVTRSPGTLAVSLVSLAVLGLGASLLREQRWQGAALVTAYFAHAAIRGLISRQGEIGVRGIATLASFVICAAALWMLLRRRGRAA